MGKARMVRRDPCSRPEALDLGSLCKWLMLALLVGFAAGAQATCEEFPPETVGEPEAAAVDSLEATPAAWLVVAACLVVAVSAGGYTFFCYLRRRDTLSTLAALEGRYRQPSDFE